MSDALQQTILTQAPTKWPKCILLATFWALTSTFKGEGLCAAEYVGLGGANTVDKSKYVDLQEHWEIALKHKTMGRRKKINGDLTSHHT